MIDPLPLPPLLLADIGEWIGLAILLLTVLGWFVNAIKGNGADGKPRAPRPAKGDLRSELEVFLEELQGNKPAQQPEPPRKPARPPQPVTKKAPPPKPRQDKKPPRRVQPSLVAPVEQGQVSPVGSGVREHVAAYMAPDRVTTQAQQHVGRRIAQAVEQDLGGGTVAPVAPADAPRSKPHPLLVALAQPNGMTQAVLMQEILQKPRALRH